MRRFLTKQAILWWCNWQRVKRGRLPRLRLRKGVPWVGSSCPVANTLGGAWVGGGSWHWLKRPGMVPTPERVREFLVAFDQREYPELVDQARLEAFGVPTFKGAL